MSKVLSELLGAQEPFFSIALQQLEQASGNESVDVRLSAEIMGKVRQKTRELGLDPKDTTAEELYHALLGLAKKHDAFLARRIGAKDASDVRDILPRMKTFMEQLDIPKSVWVLKASVAKRLLKTTPPKRTMKQLGYRSIDSMLKREPTGELYAALRFAETPEWLERFVQKYKKLSPSDFETRTIEFIQLDPKKWGDIANTFVAKNRHNLTHLKEMGVIVILPLPVRQLPGVTITVLPLLLHYVNEIRFYSAFFKLQQVQPRFGHILADTIAQDPGEHANMAGNKLHWRIIGRHFGSVPREQHPEIFEPHLQPEDLAWRKAEEVLYRIEPALHFWHDMDYVALQDGALPPVSFNLVDVAVSYVNQLQYGQQSVYHFRQSLTTEVYTRYLQRRALEMQVLKQLDSRVPQPDFEALQFEGSLL